MTDYAGGLVINKLNKPDFLSWNKYIIYGKE
jgi:hypothetical protein